MKVINLLCLLLVLLSSCHESKNEKLMFIPKIKNLIDPFVENIPKDKNLVLFIFIKSIYANSLHFSLVAKRPRQSDFELIGSPNMIAKYEDVNVLIYSGQERLFTNNRDEIKYKLEGIMDFDADSKDNSIFRRKDFVIQNDSIFECAREGDFLFTKGPLNPCFLLLFKDYIE